MVQYFKCIKGTELFKRISELQIKKNNVNQAWDEFVSSIGAEQSILTNSSMFIAGGGIGFHFKQKPENWKRVHRNYPDFYFPKSTKANNDIIQKIEELPSLRRSDFYGVINVGLQDGAKIEVGQDFILFVIDYRNSNYLPAAGMIEITGSQHSELQSKIQSESSKEVEPAPNQIKCSECLEESSPDELAMFGGLCEECNLVD